MGGSDAKVRSKKDCASRGGLGTYCTSGFELPFGDGSLLDVRKIGGDVDCFAGWKGIVVNTVLLHRWYLHGCSLWVVDFLGCDEFA